MTRIPFSNHLVYKLIILNACGAAGVVWGYSQGYVQTLFDGDTTGIGYGIVALFAVGLAAVAERSFKVSKALHELKAWKKSAAQFGAHRAGPPPDGSKFTAKQAYIGDIAVWLVTLGLIGNIVGFAIAISNLDLSGGADAALGAIGSMVAGMKVAFYTTLIGTALGLWIDINFRVLSTATELFQQDAVK
jgi:hypothetical protein